MLRGSNLSFYVWDFGVLIEDALAILWVTIYLGLLLKRTRPGLMQH